MQNQSDNNKITITIRVISQQYRKSLKISKRYSKSVNRRRTGNTIVKRQRTNNYL